MWFLWIFGDNIEDILGHGKYLVFYLLCGVAAALAQIVFNPDSRVPTVGASGAIAGCDGRVLMKFPHSRILTLVLYLLFDHHDGNAGLGDADLLVRASSFSAAWAAIGYSHGHRRAGVAFFAHVGGFLAGMALIKIAGDARALLAAGRTCTGNGTGGNACTRAWGCCLCDEAKQVLEAGRAGGPISSYEESISTPIADLRATATTTKCR